MSDRHKRNKNIISNKKAFSSIVGAIFAILVIVSLTGTFFVWSLEQNSRYVSAVADVNQRALDQQNESLNVTSVPVYVVGAGGIVTVSVSVQNDGPIPLQLAALWVQDLNGSNPYGYTTLSVNLSSGQSWSTPTDVQVAGAVPGDSFTGWLITGRGNVVPLYVGHLKGDAGQQGAPGASGTNGSQWFVGTDAPSPSTPAGAVDGDFYLDTSTNNVYRKSGGAWSYLATLKGPAGPIGPQGLPGAGFNETGNLFLNNGTNGADFNATGNVFLYNGSTSYDANTALVSQGIGAFAMNFKSVLVYTMDGSGGIVNSSQAYAFKIGQDLGFSLNVTNMDPTMTYINLTRLSCLWVFSPASGAIKGQQWPLATCTNNVITPLAGNGAVKLVYNVSTRIYFGPAVADGNNLNTGISGVNLILTGKINGMYDYGQNLPFVSLIISPKSQ